MEKNVYDQLVGIQKHLGNFALSLTLNKDEADDLTQETNLRVLDNCEKYADNTNFKGWVFTIMRNIFINNCRRTSRTKLSDDADGFINLPQAAGAESPDEAYGAKEISEIINSFPDDYRVPLSRYVAGYKYEEIADEMKIPLGTVKSRIFFARKRMKAQLAGYR